MPSVSLLIRLSLHRNAIVHFTQEQPVTWQVTEVAGGPTI